MSVPKEPRQWLRSLRAAELLNSYLVKHHALELRTLTNQTQIDEENRKCIFNSFLTNHLISLDTTHFCTKHSELWT